MTKIKKRTKSYNRYPTDLKRKIAKSYLAGEASYRILAEENGLKNKDVVKEFVRWYLRSQEKESTEMENLKDSPIGATEREKELEEELRLAKLKIEMLETMFDVAEAELNIQIRKKSGSNQSKR